MSRHRSTSLVAHPAHAIILVLTLLVGPTPAGMGRPAAANDAPAGGGAAATGFTYQGELKQGRAVASGSFAMSFTLWSAETGGTQLGGPLSFPGVDVADGRFTVELDFGVDAVRGGPAWLEATVEGFTLSPRQAVTPAPFSMTTRGIDVDGAGRVGIGTEASDQARLTVAGEGTEPAVRAATDAGATVELASPDTALRATAASPTDWAAILEGRSQLGTRAFVGRDDTITGAEYFGVLAPVATGYGGMYIATEGQPARPFYGYATAGAARAWHSWDGFDETWRLYVGGVPRLEVSEDRARGPRGMPMPIAAANVREDGTIQSQVGVVSVAVGPPSSPVYVIQLPEGTLTAAPFVAVTPQAIDSGQASAQYFVAGNQIEVLIHNFQDVLVPRPFSIIVWPGD